MPTNNKATTTTVRVVPGSAATYATALRGHLSAALAYMNLGMEIEMLCEFDSIDNVLVLLKDKAMQNVSQ